MLGQRVHKKIEGAAVEGLGGDDFISGMGNIED